MGLIRLTEKDLHGIVRESLNILLKEFSENHYNLIKEVLLNGCFYNVNNINGYDIGIGYGGGNKKEFFYPYSESMEYSFCHVTIDEINRAVKELESKGYEFEYEDEGYVFMKGERKGFNPFVPSKPHFKTQDKPLNPNTDPVGYYSDKIFTKSKNGNLDLF